MPTSTAPSIIDLAHVCKRYSGLRDEKATGIALWVKNMTRLTTNKATSILALDDVCLRVDQGEVFGIFGENGAGKTTLIKVLSGLLAPTSGVVNVNGHTDVQRIKGTISYVSTNGWMGLEWQLTARENLIMYGNMFGLSGTALSARCDEALEAVGVSEARNKYISQLSAGMRQKVTIARGLILDRPVMYYDEPSVSLDITSAHALRALIRADANDHGRTSIIASHNPEDLAVCDRIMLLSAGRVLAIGTPDQLRRPLADTLIIEITCQDPPPDSGFGALPGVETVSLSDAPGQHGLRKITIRGRRQEFSFDALADYLIATPIAVHSINETDISLAEVYGYYVAADGAGCAT